MNNQTETFNKARDFVKVTTIDHPAIATLVGLIVSVFTVLGERYAWGVSRTGTHYANKPTEALAFAAAGLEAALFTTVATSTSIIFGLSNGERIKAILAEHGKQLINVLAIGAGILFVSALVTLSTVFTNHSVEFALIMGTLATSSWVILHYGLVMVDLLGFASEDLKSDVGES